MTFTSQLPPRKSSLWVLLVLSCASGPAPAPAPLPAQTQGNDQREFASHLQASSPIGGLNEDRVDKTFKKSLGLLQSCLEAGAERIEFLGGSVDFFVKIDRNGSLTHAHLERSTLGDRQTEKCMLSALRSLRWPRPVGGDRGLARKSFEFDPPKDVRPPIEWDPGQALSAIGGIDRQIAECKGGNRGLFEATIYVGPDGSVLSAGATPPNEQGEAAVDCLVEALRAGSFPSPGSWPAKVTLPL